MRARLSHPAVSPIALLLAMIGVAPVTAQQRQYEAPGSRMAEEIDAADSVRSQMEAAAWRFGSWRVQPRLGIPQLEWVDDVFDRGEAATTGSDLKVTAVAGLDAYLPVGSDVVVAAFAHPSYTWWRDTESLRRFNLSYGGALFALFNRWTAQLTGRRIETERPINNELRLRTAIERDEVGFDNRFRLRGPWVVFASVRSAGTELPDVGDLGSEFEPLRQLERDETAWSGGIGYERGAGLRIDVGYETVDTDFPSDPGGRSNRSEAPFTRLRWTGNRVGGHLEAGERTLDFDNPALGEITESVGRGLLDVELGHRTRLALYASRAVVYSALDRAGYFSSTNTGAGVAWGEPRRLTVRLFAETGRDDFVSAGGPNEGRIDDVDAVGLSFTVPFGERLELVLGLTEIDIDSNLDANDRSLTVGTSAVRLALPDVPF